MIRGVSFVVLAACAWGTWSLFLRPLGLPSAWSSTLIFVFVSLLAIPLYRREITPRWDREALVLVLAADHVVRKPDEFREACQRAAAAAAEGRIVTFGIEPTHPATNYGYIRPGGKLNGASVRAVEAFVEKPDAATAAESHGIRHGIPGMRERAQLAGGTLSAEAGRDGMFRVRARIPAQGRAA